MLNMKMTLEEARQKIKDFNATGEYISLGKNYSTLDGVFSVKELRDIADLMEQVNWINAPEALISEERR